MPLFTSYFRIVLLFLRVVGLKFQAGSLLLVVMWSDVFGIQGDLWRMSCKLSLRVTMWSVQNGGNVNNLGSLWQDNNNNKQEPGSGFWTRTVRPTTEFALVKFVWQKFKMYSHSN